jgi:predicted TIM-barrel fold metal-dependent hydrolase
MRKFENLKGDLSAGSGFNALARDPEYAVGFLNEFQDRLMFGTDICAPNTPTPLVDLLNKCREDGAISNGTFDKIAQKNASTLLNI